MLEKQSTTSDYLILFILSMYFIALVQIESDNV